MVTIDLLEQREKIDFSTVKNVYVGCGNDKKEGYTGCDIRKTPNAEIVCNAWDLSKQVRNLDNIYSKNLCEHLTYKEFRETLKDWYTALSEDGLVHIIVPNLIFCSKSLQNTQFNIENLCENISRIKDRNEYKSGYNDKLIRMFLEDAGFVHITCEIIDNIYLSVFAKKPGANDYRLNSGERQVGTSLDQIRKDHTNRYELAADIIGKNCRNGLLKGLDIFCGNGYGDEILTQKLNAKITAYDASEEAIELAKRYYQNNNIEFICKKFPFELGENDSDFIVSLESIEHVKEYRLFIKELSKSLKDDGVLIISSPNELKNSLIKNRNPFHYRHFTSEEFVELFKEFGFECIEIYGQDCYQFDNEGHITGVLESDSMEIIKDYDGQFNIYIFRKSDSKL